MNTLRYALYFIILALIFIIFESLVLINNINTHVEKYRNVLPVSRDLPMRQAVLNTFSSYGLDQRLAERIIKCESSWRPNVVNKYGMKGLWQISPIHNLTDEVKFDPIKSTRWSAEKILRDKSCRAWDCC